MSASDVQIQIIGKDLASAAFKSVDASAKRTEAQMASLGSSAGRMGGMFRSAASVTAGIAGYEGISSIMQKSVGAAFEFATGLEASANGMAGILMSMGQVDGRTLEWGESLSVAQGIITRMNDEALRTAATSQELVRGVQALLAPGLASGMNITQIETLTVTGVNAVKLLQLQSYQVVQELRDLVAGGIQPASSTLATALGLKDSDIQAAKASSQGLFNFLMERLKGFEVASGEYAKTFKGLNEQIKEGLTRGAATGMGAGLEFAKEQMKGLAEKIVTIDETTKTVQINPVLVSTIGAMTQNTIAFVGEMKKIGEIVSPVVVPAVEMLGSAIGYAARNASDLTFAVGGWMIAKQAQVIYMDVAAATAGAATAQTLLGRAVIETNAQQTRQRAMALEAAAVQKAAVTEQVIAIKSLLAAEAQRTSGLMKMTAGYVDQASVVDKARLALIGATQAAKNGEYSLAQSIISTNEVLAAQGAIATAVAEKQVAGAVAAAGAQKSLAATTATASAFNAGASVGMTAASFVGKAAWKAVNGWFGAAVLVSYYAYDEIWKNREEIKRIMAENYNNNLNTPQSPGEDYLFGPKDKTPVANYGENRKPDKKVSPGSGDPLRDQQGPLQKNDKQLSEITGKYNKQKEEIMKIEADLQTSILQLQGFTLQATLNGIEKEKKAWIEKGVNKVAAEQWAAAAITKANKDAADKIKTAYEQVKSSRESVASTFQGSFGSAIDEVMQNIKNNRSENAYEAVEKMRKEFEIRQQASRAVASAAGFSDAEKFDPVSPWQSVNKSIEAAAKAQIEYLKIIAQNTARPPQSPAGSIQNPKDPGKANSFPPIQGGGSNPNYDGAFGGGQQRNGEAITPGTLTFEQYNKATGMDKLMNITWPAGWTDERKEKWGRNLEGFPIPGPYNDSSKKPFWKADTQGGMLQSNSDQVERARIIMGNMSGDKESTNRVRALMQGMKESSGDKFAPQTSAIAPVQQVSNSLKFDIQVNANGMDQESARQLGNEAAKQMLPRIEQAINQSRTSFAGPGLK